MQREMVNVSEEKILSHLREDVIPYIFNARKAKKLLRLSDKDLMDLAPHLLSLDRKLKRMAAGEKAT